MNSGRPPEQRRGVPRGYVGALTAAVTYCLGRDVYDRQVGLIAGLLAISSPFFLILAGTFMSHTVGGLWVAVLLWSWRRIELAQAAGGSGRGWSTLGGAALGMLAITRPLTGVAVGAVFGLALAVQATRRHRELQRVLRANAPLAGVALLIALLQPLWLWLSTGSPTTNLYTMVWEYDRVGFGPEVGRTGHTLGEGLRTAWRDLQLWAGDLFGWRYLSWLPPALGVVLGVWRGGPGRRGWALLLAGPLVALVVFHLAYWIGAQVYGPRYYYEAHAGLAVLAALGLRETVRLVAGGGGERSPGGWRDLLGGDAALVYIPLAALIALNLVAYLPQRLPDWRDVYDITPAPFKALREQAGNQPVLVIVQGGRWVDYAPFFAHNSPWLDGPTVAAHDVSPGVNAAIIRQYPGYSAWFYSEGVLTPIRPAVAGEE